MGALHPPRQEEVYLFYLEVQDHGLDLCNCRGHCKITTTTFVTQNFLLDDHSQQ